MSKNAELKALKRLKRITEKKIAIKLGVVETMKRLGKIIKF